MISIAKIIAAREQAALLVAGDPVYVPIFDRLDREVIAMQANDPVARARAVVAASDVRGHA